MAGKRFRVAGRVQGVGFRRFVAHVAGQLGLAGTVRNATDGSVEVTAWGPVASLELLRSRLASGPRFSEVTNVESFEISDELHQVTGFRIVG